MTVFKRLSAAAFLTALPAAFLFAHGLIVNTDLRPPAVVMSASYDGGGIPAFAAASVFAPDAAESPYQSGRADASGRFAFLPDLAGEWTVLIDDEMGHRRKTVVVIDEGFLNPEEAAPETPAVREAAPSAPAGLPALTKLLVGLSLIFGITGIAMSLKARRDLRSAKSPSK